MNLERDTNREAASQTWQHDIPGGPAATAFAAKEPAGARVTEGHSEALNS